MAQKYLNKVKEFHQTFSHPIGDMPFIPDEVRSSLRVKLIKEETGELEEAILKGDVVAAADAMADLQYVLSGAVLEFGMYSVFDKIFDEVHESNMSKACLSIHEAERTAEHYKSLGVETQISFDQDSEKYIVYRKSDNKILKSVFYNPPEIKKIIEDEC